MKTRPLARLAAIAAGGVLALTVGAPAMADDHLPGDLDLNSGHTDETAQSGDWPNKCSADEFNDFPEGPIPEGFDGWHFRVAGGGAAFTELNLEFTDSSGGTVVITIDEDGASGDDGKEYTGWIRTSPDGHAYLFTPGGWTLNDGAAYVDGGSPKHFNVSHTCPADGAAPSPTPTTTPSATPTSAPTDTPTAKPTGTPAPTATTPGGGDDDEDVGGLPVTGMEVGGIAAVGALLLTAGGAALLLVRRHRRQSLSKLLQEN